MIKVIIGFILLLVGLSYLYRPDSIIKINSWVKANVFNDQVIINHRRKIGVVIILIGIIFLCIGIN